MIPKSKSYFWDIAFVVSVYLVFTWRLWANASSFDGTEISTIVESGVWAVGAVSALIFCRRDKE